MMDSEPRPADVPSATANAPWTFSFTALRQVAGRVWLFWDFHNLSLLAGGVAFFCFLGITPQIAAIVLVYGLVADVDAVREQMAVLTGVVPRDAASLLQGQLTHVVTTSATAKGISLVVAIAVAVYGAMYAAMYAANG